jgi:hypothetical protein
LVVAQNLAIGNADACLVGFKVIGRGELHRVRGDHGQMMRAASCTAAITWASSSVRARHAAIPDKNGAETRRQAAAPIPCARFVALHQRLPTGPPVHLTGNQALVQFLQPRQLDDGLVFDDVLGVGPGQQLGQVQIALLVLHQQHHARQGSGIAAQAFQKNLDPNDGFGTLGACLLVKLDGAKQVAQVGDG